MRRHLTLVLTIILHAFTHAYATMLIPLYLVVQRDLHLPGIKSVGWIVTIYGGVYFLLSYPAGMLADRFNRKTLLGLGLMLNAIAIAAMGYLPGYWPLVTCGVVAGVAGAIFHPAGNAMCAALYPASPGMAIGLLGIGSGLGFWAGPHFAGWRAEQLANTLGSAAWRTPVIEAGVTGLIVGVLFLLIARDAPRVAQSLPTIEATDASPSHGSMPSRDSTLSSGSTELHDSVPSIGSTLLSNSPPSHELTPLRDSTALPVAARRTTRQPMGRSLAIKTLVVAVVLGCRDFSGTATLSLISIYLLKAFSQTTGRVGFIVGTMMLGAMLTNPLMVWLTPGRRRLPGLSVICVLGGLIIFSLPHWPLAAVLPIMCGYMALQLGSYAVSDASILERVPGSSRGRVTGLFLTWAGTFSATGPFVVGWWTDSLGDRASDPHAYASIFAGMAILMFIAAGSTPFIARLGRAGAGTIEPITELLPATMPAVG